MLTSKPYINVFLMLCMNLICRKENIMLVKNVERVLNSRSIKNNIMKVYKAGANSIITLELLPNSKTNETRSNVYDPNFAKFRTNKAKVISIIHDETNDIIDN